VAAVGKLHGGLLLLLLLPLVAAGNARQLMQSGVSCPAQIPGCMARRCTTRILDSRETYVCLRCQRTFVPVKGSDGRSIVQCGELLASELQQLSRGSTAESLLLCRVVHAQLLNNSQHHLPQWLQCNPACGSFGPPKLVQRVQHTIRTVPNDMCAFLPTVCPQGTFLNSTEGSSSIGTCADCPVNRWCPGGDPKSRRPNDNIGGAARGCNPVGSTGLVTKSRRSTRVNDCGACRLAIAVPYGGHRVQCAS
jgi:hypothetical protein